MRGMLFDAETAVFINSGPSLDRLAPAAWEAIRQAGEVIAVNGALVAEASRSHDVRFTCAVAMDAGTGAERNLDEKVPGFREAWDRTPAWRITKSSEGAVDAETFIRLQPLRWSDDNPDAGYAGGGSAASACNWFANPWPDDPGRWAELRRIAARTGRRIPRRGFRRFAFLGLDMVPGEGGHARGAGMHQSGFTSGPERDRCLRDRWKTLCDAAGARGIAVINYTHGTGLEEMPRGTLPAGWLLDRPAAGAKG
jgi:hypothetical protein